MSDADDDRGLSCPTCGCRHLPVYYTRQHSGRVTRCRECRHCGRRILTHERVTGAPGTTGANGATGTPRQATGTPATEQTSPPSSTGGRKFSMRRDSARNQRD